MDAEEYAALGMMLGAIGLAVAIIALICVLTYGTRKRQYEECRAHGFSPVFCQQWQVR